jgi:hypothetical protein
MAHMKVYRNNKNTPANKHKEVRSNLQMNNTIEIVMKAEFIIGGNENWATELFSQNAEYKTIAQTTAILFPRVPGMLMKWWEN